MARPTKFIQVTTSGFTNLETKLNSIFLQDVVLPAQTTIRRAADDVAFIAREMAPLKTGSLESAIEQPSRNIRREGFKVESMVWVNPRVWNPDDHIKVGDYMYEAHQEITPYGNKKLGLMSRMKQDTVAVEVGGGFMDRAWEFSKPWIFPQVAQAVRDALEKYNR